MKRILLGLLLVVMLGASMVAAQDGIAGNYDDPNGQFTVPIPTNWTAVTTESGAVLLSAPGDTILMYMLVVENESAEAAVAAGWEQIGVTFEQTARPQTVPSSPGFDETVVVNYGSGMSVPFYQGLAQRIGTDVYTLLIVLNDLAAAGQRGAQIQIIASGFQPTSLVTTDLSAVMPLPVDETIIAALEDFIALNLPLSEVPGLSLAIVQDGEIVYANGYGVRSLEGDEPVDADTYMMIGSITKSMTTLMMATLVDDGLMAWDTPAVEILPTFAVADPALTEQITMQNLVCACTGVPRRDMELLFNANEQTGEDSVEMLRTFRFFTDFGEAFQYSNQMVAAGGYIAAVAAGGSYGTLDADYFAAMQERVFDPIGMTRTTFDFATVLADDNYALPHGSAFDETDAYYLPLPIQTEELLLPVAPAGAAWSTANDMARYLITQMNQGISPDGEQVVSAENLLTTWQPQVSISATVSYGLGWIVGDYKGAPLITHGGNTLGFTAEAAFLPAHGLGIVVLTNGQSANSLAEGVRTRLFELVFEIEQSEAQEGIDFLLARAEELEPELLASVGAYDAEAAAALVGTYSNDVLGTVVVSIQNDALIADAGEFTAVLRPAQGENDEPNTWMAINAPLAGQRLKFDPEALTLTFDITTDQYVFERVE
jgi:CubicO group peptidase (beta-lactamase class C family)